METKGVPGCVVRLCPRGHTHLQPRILTTVLTKEFRPTACHCLGISLFKLHHHPIADYFVHALLPVHVSQERHNHDGVPVLLVLP